VALDQVGFQNQRFFFGVGQNGLIRSDLGEQQRGFGVMGPIGLKVGLEPLFQIARFAHINDGTLIVLHEVDPGQVRHMGQLFGQGLAVVLFIARFDFHKPDELTKRLRGSSPFFKGCTPAFAVVTARGVFTISSIVFVIAKFRLFKGLIKAGTAAAVLKPQA